VVLVLKTVILLPMTTTSRCASSAWRRRAVLFTHGNLAHLCMCRACALRYDWCSGGCAVCRQPVEQVVHLDYGVD
jgi:hypothetical protein